MKRTRMIATIALVAAACAVAATAPAQESGDVLAIRHAASRAFRRQVPAALGYSAGSQVCEDGDGGCKLAI